MLCVQVLVHPRRERGRPVFRDTYVTELLALVERRNPGEPEFQQAVREVVTSLAPVLERNPHYVEERVLERIVEPERVVMFRVPWVDDDGQVQIERGYRVEMSSAIGPYKGGLRFHPTVDVGLLKFLAFEQVLKNALTTLPLGGGKGGADFDPKGRSDAEVMRFCQSFMTELQRHIGPFTDVPAGDIGVGTREIGFLFGQYKRIRNEFSGVLTGKALEWGGSRMRPEATGYGTVYFAAEMLATRGDGLEGKRCLVSGAGNVAQYTVEKLLHLGAAPLTLSDSGGFVHDPDGIDEEKLDWVKELKNLRRGRIAAYPDRFPRATYTPVDPRAESNPLWSVPADCAFPSATQNEIGDADARHLLHGGVTLVAEGANMPSRPAAVERFLAARILYGPGKAANAGGVAVSGLEMSQDAMRLTWSSDEVDARLRSIMHEIHAQARATAEEYDRPGNYVVGANAAGFVKVADAVLDQGVV
jgi:glutamate dehydrogenase (NADP+)